MFIWCMAKRGTERTKPKLSSGSYQNGEKKERKKEINMEIERILGKQAQNFNLLYMIGDN